MYPKLYEALRAAGHVLQTTEDGDIDTFALDYEYHNGPACVLCHQSWCEHCEVRGDGEFDPCPNGALEGEFTNVTNQKQIEQEKGE